MLLSSDSIKLRKNQDRVCARGEISDPKFTDKIARLEAASKMLKSELEECKAMMKDEILGCQDMIKDEISGVQRSDDRAPGWDVKEVG